MNDNNTENQAKLEAANYDLSQKGDKITSLKENFNKAQKSLEQVQAQRESLKRTATEHISQNMVNDRVMKKAKITDSLQREVNALHQQKYINKWCRRRVQQHIDYYSKEKRITKS